MKDKSRGKGCIGCKLVDGKTCHGCTHQQDIVKESRAIITESNGNAGEVNR